MRKLTIFILVEPNLHYAGLIPTLKPPCGIQMSSTFLRNQFFHNLKYRYFVWQTCYLALLRYLTASKCSFQKRKIPLVVMIIESVCGRHHFSVISHNEPMRCLNLSLTLLLTREIGRYAFIPITTTYKSKKVSQVTLDGTKIENFLDKKQKVEIIVIKKKKRARAYSRAKHESRTSGKQACRFISHRVYQCFEFVSLYTFHENSGGGGMGDCDSESRLH